ncbi:hypothetical protein ROZALSC1DRAFT_26651 [Rozella allomycis CSF55]|uniref:Queuosine 5'-phosphate N-glycosylase/hydrolase n=1 Tax=Rozella allomycis (strain CSF55) TaxID=988480 RepID=A0A075B295_ROZAC|nr:hypothetical protein O9G_005091 [Rozella allomycis CSF55]RKP21966.1 hypothetical protein ROZALSC1DRAFT_26651 [Rozella allomycis CSF55]|eukprot:EPZ36647.1 hypothetical protein O9G_005091 [Rozella allomycis CSF55]
MKSNALRCDVEISKMTVEKTDLTQTIVASCKEIIRETKLIEINEERMREFISSIDLDLAKDSSPTIDNIPFKFDNLEQKVTFVALKGYLSFGTSFDKLLKDAGRDNSSNIMEFGLYTMHITYHNIKNEILSNISLSDVSSLFNIPVSYEDKVMDGVYASKPGPLKPLAESIKLVLNDLGNWLSSQKYKSLGSFILQLAKSCGKNTNEFIRKLSIAQSHFFDVYQYDGKSVYFYKKAQHLAYLLAKNFPNEVLLNCENLSYFADLKHVAFFQSLGIINICDGFDTCNQQDQIILSRASLIATTDKLISMMSKSDFNNVSLYFYVQRLMAEQDLNYIEDKETLLF